METTVSQENMKDLLLKHIGVKELREWALEKQPSILSVTYFAARVVETLKTKGAVSPGNALAASKELFPIILGILKDNSVLTGEKHDEIMREFVEKSFLFQGALDLILDIAKNPEVVQATNWVKKRVKSSCVCWKDKGDKTKITEVRERKYYH